MSNEKEKQTKPTEQKPDESLGEFYLPDGTPVNFDLHKISRKEVLALIRGEMEDDEALSVMSRVTGLKIEKFDDLPWDTWKRFMKAFHMAIASPVSSIPNSASGSTSE